MNISDFEEATTYRHFLIKESKLTDDESFSLLTCLLDLEDKQSVEIMEWNELIREHCRFQDIRGGMYSVVSKFIIEKQFIDKCERAGLRNIIQLSDAGKAFLDQIRLEVCIEERNRAKTLVLEF